MTTFPPSFELIGELVEIDIKEPTQLQPKPSALAVFKFGPERVWSNDVEANFVNDIYIKLPFNTYSLRIERLVPGTLIKVKGRLQCVQKRDDDAPRVELVAETVQFPSAADSR